MIPKDFYTVYGQCCSLYITDFDTETYVLVPQASSYKVDIKPKENFNNYTYYYKIFGLDGKLLTINGWTLRSASFHKAWNVNYSPMINLTDPQGICLDDYRIPNPFSKREERNVGCEFENRFRETFAFMQYISQFQNIYDFKTVHKTPLLDIDDVIRYYLECLKIKDRLPQTVLSYITDIIKGKFENYLQKDEE